MDNINTIFTFLALAMVTHKCHGLYGYDCGNTLTNATTISLVDIGNCDISRSETVNKTNEMILLQLDEYEVTHVIQCLVKLTRTITKCGWRSHASRVVDGESTYHKEVSRNECKKMYETWYYMLSETPLHDIKKNVSDTRNVVLAGSANREGACTNGRYSDQSGKWEDVYVAGYVETFIKDYYASVNVDNDKIILQLGTTCTLQSKTCLDYDGSSVCWKSLPTDSCGFHRYSVLYRGLVVKIEEKDAKEKRTMYTVETKETAFALLKKVKK